MIGILCATKQEYKNIQKNIENITEEIKRDTFVFSVGSIANCQVIVLKTGIGNQSAYQGAEFLLKERAPSLLLSAGTAGALSPDMVCGDVVIGSEVVEYKAGVMRAYSMDSAVTDFLYENIRRMHSANISSNKIVKGRIVSLDTILCDVEKRNRIYKESGGACVEMESSGVAKCCKEKGIKFVPIKIISDHADHAILETIRKNEKIVTETLGQIIYSSLKQYIENNCLL